MLDLVLLDYSVECLVTTRQMLHFDLAVICFKPQAGKNLHPCLALLANELLGNHNLSLR